MATRLTAEEQALRNLRIAAFALLAAGTLGCEIERRIFRLRQRASRWQWRMVGELERPSSVIRDLGISLLDATSSRPHSP